MALSFQATMAQEESHSKSRCMEQSLRMRLDHGIPLTPDRIGFRKDKISGKLYVCETEYETVKLAYYMVLLGYTTDEIAEIYTNQGRKTRAGKNVWTRDSITAMLRSERNCGDVLTRKTYTPSYLDHKAKKNRGERPQSQYLNWHEPIVTRDDYLAVQKLLDNQKYGNRSILPKLKVITGGLLKGYVIINPRWAGFTENDYFVQKHCFLFVYRNRSVLSWNLCISSLCFVDIFRQKDRHMIGLKVVPARLCLILADEKAFESYRWFHRQHHPI